VQRLRNEPAGESSADHAGPILYPAVPEAGLFGWTRVADSYVAPGAAATGYHSPIACTLSDKRAEVAFRR